MDLERIISKAKAGDREAFATLYTLYFVPIHRYLFVHLGNKADADDLAQDVFTKALVSFSRYTHTGAPIAAYFYTIARNSLIDWQRKKKPEKLEDEIALTLRDTGSDPEENASTHEETDELIHLLSHLAPDQREALVLRFTNGLSSKEVGEIMGKSEEAVRKLQSRGLERLRQLYNSLHHNENHE